jgi:iron only hydrogenase large subunit-like protein
VYHVAVMPCADKKLEASRDDFFLPGTTTPEVDCVVTSLEVLQLLQVVRVHLSKCESTSLSVSPPL